MAALNISINDLLRDDLTLAVLAADGLSTVQFRETLEAAARRIRLRNERESRPASNRTWSARDLGVTLACCGA